MNTTFQFLYDNMQDFTNDEFDTINEVVKLEWDRRAAMKKFTFTPGQEVYFKGRRGQTLYGKVRKINAKTIKVDVHTPHIAHWTVYPNHLFAI